MPQTIHHHLSRIAVLPALQLPLLLLNLILATALMVVWPSHKNPAPTTPAVVANHSAPTPQQTASITTPAKPTASPLTFHWRQLDAPDFPTFVKNLRAIGCPEATIQDIVQGELNEIYAAKRQEVEHAIATSPISARTALKQHLLQLQAEADHMLAAAMRDTPATSTSVATTPATTGFPSAAATPSSSSYATAITGTAMTPAAFLVGNAPSQPASVTRLSLTPSDPPTDQTTTQVLSQLRETFATAMNDAGANADPASPAYRQRWLLAQRASDEKFSSLFGGDAFVRTQSQSVQAAAAPNP